MYTDCKNLMKPLFEKRKRVWEIDMLRGFCILLMIMDHFFYNLTTTFSYLSNSSITRYLVMVARTYYMSDLREMGWIVAVGIFMFLSGLSTALTKSNSKRGFKILLLAYLITFFTMLMDELFQTSFTINFGVLHTLGFCVLIFALCIEKGKKIKLFRVKYLDVSLGDIFILILIACSVYLTLSHDVGLFFAPSYVLFDNLFNTPIGYYWEFILGTNFNVLLSSDYFPLLPWIAIFMVGALFADKLYPSGQSLFPSADFMNKTPLARIGKKTLFVYIAHQPVIFVILALIGLIFTGKFISF